MQRRSQRGMSYFGVMLAIMLFAGVIKAVATVGSDYYDNYTIGKIIQNIISDGRTDSIATFKRALSDRFQVNGIRNRAVDDFEYSMEGNNLVVVVDYEVRKNFIGNLDIVMHFNKTYSSELKAEQ